VCWRFDRWAKDGTFDRVLAELQGFAHVSAELEWVVSVDSTIARAHQRAAGARRQVRGDWSNHKVRRPEPADHALGHSRGGGRPRPTPPSMQRAGRWRCGSRRDRPGTTRSWIGVLDDIAVPTGGRARSRPQVLIADKAYSHPSTRKALRRRQIRTVIPERSDQKAHCAARGSRGGRPPAFDSETYKFNRPRFSAAPIRVLALG
jgi:transposase